MRKILSPLLLGLLVALLTACGTTGTPGGDGSGDDNGGGSCEEVDLQGLWNMTLVVDDSDAKRSYVLGFDQTGTDLTGSVDQGLSEDIGAISGTIDGCDVSLDIDFTAAGHPDLDAEVTANLLSNAFSGNYTTAGEETGNVVITKRTTLD